MNTYHKLEITLNCNQFGYKKTRQQTVKWLHNIIPVIMQSQQMVTSNIYLRASQQMATFCLS